MVEVVMTKESNTSNKSDLDCEYSLLVSLAAAKSVESLDENLENLLDIIFGPSVVDILNPSNAVEIDSSQGLRVRIATSLDEHIRDVVVHEPLTSPKRRYLDAALSIYTHHYELLLKSQIDKLTGLLNRLVLEEKIKSLDGAMVQAGRRDSEFNRIIVLFDIDHFKTVNDRFGHLYGDEVLVLVSHMMKQAFRLDDWLFRYGGEEFIVLLNNIELEDARTVIDRFLKNVASHNFPQIGKVTVSAGYTEYKATQAFTMSLEAADKALYFSKENGRNQHNNYEELVKQGHIDAIERDSGIDLF